MRSAYTILFLLVFLKPDYALAQDSHGCLTRAAALIDRSLFSEAIEIYTEAMEKDNDYRLFTGRGDAFLMAGMTDEAARDYAMANQLRPGSGYLGLARAYALSNQTEDAISNLKYHLQSAFKLARKDILLDPYFTYMEDSPAWKQLWKDRWYSQLEDAEAETEYYVRTGKIERAREVLSEVEHIYSEQTPILYLKGLIESAVNNSSGALKYLGAAVDRDDSTYDAWRLYIEQLGNKGDYLSAANACDRALSYFPGQTGLILEKAENLRLANDRGRALLTAEGYLSLYPDDELANRQVGIIAGETG
ncbi:MAG: hypothetical protein KFF49_08015, partial [Bacteroidales bacterium]|nr:hypothetical protein [Bacteroidales bacterium]